MVSVKDHDERAEDNLTWGVLTKRFVSESKDSEYISVEYLSMFFFLGEIQHSDM